MLRISLDTEGTGVDLYHGAKPFMASVCTEIGQPAVFWEWDVDPLTREPEVPFDDLVDIKNYIDEADEIVFQNPKYDITALRTLSKKLFNKWPWHKTRDTLLAGHLLASNQPHDLTSMVLIYLGVNIKPFEDALEKATKEARRLAKTLFPQWRLAHKELPEMPSAKESTWKYDMWLPRAIAKELKYEKDHPWWTVCSDYNTADTETTLPLLKRQLEKIEERGLLAIYLERCKILPIVPQMEWVGVTVSKERLDKLVEVFGAESKNAAKVCTTIAKSFGYDLELPKSGNNKSLKTFIFSEDYLNLPVLSVSEKTGEPGMDKEVVEKYLTTLEEDSKAYRFIDNLRNKRKRDTALAYMESYQRFWLPCSGVGQGWFVLHPSLNPTGTTTLRWSCANPNEQNISKQEGFSLRYCFGPAPGREWWSLDAKNIELRIPAYEANEKEMIYLFEHPDDGPYYGSNHLLVFDTLHPEKFKKYGVECKKIYASTWYQRTKNGNFAVQYGAIDRDDGEGTADRAYGIPGAQKRIKARFKKQEQLNQQMIRFAEEHGYVETMPDKTVDPNHGYPLLCTRTRWNKIKPTVPLNYHVQGTAMWWMQKAMTRCHNYLMQKPGYYMIMQVHDELVFDFPKDYKEVNGKPVYGNLPVIKHIQKLMEQGGDDIGVPTPVSCEYHAVSWGEGVSI